MTISNTDDDIDRVFDSLHAQPTLTDGSRDGDRWIWVYGNELARIKVIRDDETN